MTKKRKTPSTVAARLLVLPKLAAEEPYWRHVWLFLSLAFVLRVAVALAGDFVIHSDEIMQYLEPAHALVFDRGLLHWEYYHGARSWLLPGFIAGILWLCQLAGLDQPAIYTDVVKMVFCLISILVPYSMYVAGRHLFGETSGRIGLVFGAFWYELIVFAHKPMTEFVATALILFLLAFVVRPSPASAWRPAVATIIGVLACAIRFHYLPAICLILLAKFVSVDNRARIAMVSAGAVGLLGVGLFELITWGGFFHSYRVNFMVNFFLNEVRNEIYTPLHFPIWLTVTSGGLFLLAIIFGGIFWRRQFLIVALIASILLPHMWENHREYRFVFLVIPFWLMLSADTLAAVISAKIRHRHWLFLVATGCLAAISAIGVGNNLPRQGEVYSSDGKKFDFLGGADGYFSLYLQLGADSSVEAVLEEDIYYSRTPGYYYLHRDIPLYNAVPRDAAIISELNRHVSHIVVKHQHAYPLSKIIHDKETDQLIYRGDGRNLVIQGFELVEAVDGVSLWRRINADIPVPRWKRYVIFPNHDGLNSAIYRAVPGARPAPQNHGIELANP